MKEEGMTPKDRKVRDKLRGYQKDFSRGRDNINSSLGTWVPATAFSGASLYGAPQNHSGSFQSGGGVNFWEDDIIGGRQYTNFESKNKTYGNSNQQSYQRRRQEAKTTRELAKEEAKKWEKVRTIPPDMDTRVIKWDPKQVVCFMGRDHWLGSFYRSHPVFIDGHGYPTVEHYYQACKLFMLGGAQYSNQIRRIQDAGSVKVAAKNLLRNVASEMETELWKVHEGPRLVAYGMMHKFVQNPELRKKLLDTGNAILVQTNDKDKIFAAGMNEENFQAWVNENEGNSMSLPSTLTPETLPYFPYMGNGKNLLGLILMRVRDSIRRYSSLIEQKEKLIAAADGDAEKLKKEKEPMQGMDDVLATAIASLASMPKLDPDLIPKLEALRLKDKERREKRKEEWEQRQKAHEENGESQNEESNGSTANKKDSSTEPTTDSGDAKEASPPAAGGVGKKSSDKEEKKKKKKKDRKDKD